MSRGTIECDVIGILKEVLGRIGLLSSADLLSLATRVAYLKYLERKTIKLRFAGIFKYSKI